MLKIVEKDATKLAILTLNGDPLSQPDADLIREKTKGIVEAQVRHLLFDMTGVRYINSAGLGALMAALLTMTREGGTVQFTGIGPNVEKIFATTRLNRIFDIIPSADEAILRWSG